MCKERKEEKARDRTWGIPHSRKRRKASKISRKEDNKRGRKRTRTWSVSKAKR